MKNFVTIICCLVLLVAISNSVKGNLPAPNEKTNDSIHVLSSPDLFEISTSWVETYKKSYPEVKMNVISASPEMISQAMQNSGNIVIVSKAYYPELDEQKNWSMIVGRNVLVPIMNPENPFITQIKQKGISPEAFASVFTNNTKQNWGTLLNNQELNKLKCYLSNSKTAKLFLSDFINSDEQKLVDIEFVNDAQLIQDIKNNKFAIGFCKLSALIDNKTNELQNGISLIPIDVNGNQKLDNFENIYINAAELTRGLWIGKYPNELYSRIYTITTVPPNQKSEVAFLNWILDDGQNYLSTQGLTEITSIEQKRRTQSLIASQSQIPESKPQTSISSIFLILLALGIAVILVMYSIYSFRNYKIHHNTNMLQSKPSIFGENTVEALNGLFFDKTHTWAFMDRNGGIRIGIDDFLQHVTGTITKIKMKAPGEFIKKGEPFITLIQQGKQIEINAPVSGKIKQNNANLHTKASLINSSPYGEGWIYEIESDNWLKEIKSFLMGDSYKIWIKSEFERLKTFFSLVINNKQIIQNQLVMQEGGELNDNILENFGPEIWEEFQMKFINNSV